MGESSKPKIVQEGTYYGKSCVKVLRLHREGAVHYIREFEVSVNLSLISHQDYERGNNSDIIATDSQKNTVYALAKTKGIKSAEQFGQDICQHFLDTYHKVISVQVHIDEAPWKRIGESATAHNHAFILSHQATRFADVFQERYRSAKVWGGLKDMKILKSTQSGFVNFVRDRFTSLPETKDRVFSTIVMCKWLYSDTRGVDQTWETVKSTILEVFAGPPDSGVYSASVQNTMYTAQKLILDRVPQYRIIMEKFGPRNVLPKFDFEEVELIRSSQAAQTFFKFLPKNADSCTVDQVEMEMPNVHYFLADLAKIGMDNNNEVLMPTDKPFGLIRGAVRRPPTSKL